MNERSKSKMGNTARGKRPDVELEDGLPFIIDFMEAAADKVKMVRWRAEMLDWLQDQHECLERLLLQHDPSDMLGNLIMVEIAHNPETNKETEHEELAAVVEYIALIYLGHPHSAGSSLPLGLRGDAVLEASARAKRILHRISAYYASEGTLLEDQQGEKHLDYFRYKTISHEMFVLNPCYPHHQRQQLEQLFAPFQEWMVTYVGFCVADVLRIEDAVKDVTNSLPERTRFRDFRCHFPTRLGRDSTPADAAAIRR